MTKLELQQQLHRSAHALARMGELVLSQRHVMKLVRLHLERNSPTLALSLLVAVKDVPVHHPENPPCS